MRILISFLLLSFVVVLLLNGAQCRKVNCKDSCCTFVENIPVRLRALRSTYAKIRDHYEDNDDLDVALLNRTVLEYFEGPYGCHVMNEILHFYLDTVLPSAITNQRFRTQIDEIGSIFQQIKRDLIKCRNYFSCQKPFEISSIKNSYSKMKDKGLYKAMGELDLLFNYIENYLASKRNAN